MNDVKCHRLDINGLKILEQGGEPQEREDAKKIIPGEQAAF